MDVDSVTRLSANDRKKLKRVFDLIDEVLSSSAPDAEGPTANAKVAFDSVCGKCDRAILWTTTTKSGRWVALDERDGPYVVLGDGKADWRGGGGFAYHFDGSRDGCPKQIPEQNPSDEPRTYRDWQSVYD
jgi:hypothetical protein